MSGVEFLVALAIAVGLAGILVPVLPGSVLILGAVLVWALDVGGATAWAVFGVVAVILVVGGVVKYLVPNRRLKSVGVPARRSGSARPSVSSGSSLSRSWDCSSASCSGCTPPSGVAWAGTLALDQGGAARRRAQHRHRAVAGVAATLVWVGGVLAT